MFVFCLVENSIISIFRPLKNSRKNTQKILTVDSLYYIRV